MPSNRYWIAIINARFSFAWEQFVIAYQLMALKWTKDWRKSECTMQLHMRHVSALKKHSSREITENWPHCITHSFEKNWCSNLESKVTVRRAMEYRNGNILPKEERLLLDELTPWTARHFVNSSFFSTQFNCPISRILMEYVEDRSMENNGRIFHFKLYVNLVSSLSNRHLVTAAYTAS